MRYQDQVIAGHYATLSGLLAGFALTCIILLLTVRTTAVGNRKSEGRSAEPRLTITALQAAENSSLFYSAFVGLTLVSLSYALLAGSQEDLELYLASAHIHLGLAFVSSAFALFVAITNLVEAMAGEYAAGVLIIARISVPILMWFSVVSGTSAALNLMPSEISRTGGVSLAIGIVVILVIWIGIGTFKRSPINTRDWQNRQLSWAALVVTILGIVLANLSSMLPSEGSETSVWMITLSFVVVTTLMCAVVLGAAATGWRSRSKAKK